MSLNDVQSALQCAFREFLPGDVPIAEENKKFVPPKNKIWAITYFMPNAPAIATLSEEGYDRATGIFQIDINYPVDSGTFQPRADYENMRSAVFYGGARHWSGGQDVLITGFARNLGQPTNGFYRVVFTVYWTAIISRK